MLLAFIELALISLNVIDSSKSTRDIQTNDNCESFNGTLKKFRGELVLYFLNR